MTVSADLAARLARGRRLTDEEIGSLAGTYDIITIGMMADEVRRRLHGTRTTFLRVADVPAASGDATSWPRAAGEIRIVGTPLSRTAAVERVRQVSELAGGIPVSGFSLLELERLAAGDGVTLRSLLEELQAAGLELVADASFDRLQDPRRAIEEVNISGLALARLTIHQLATSEVTVLFRRVADLQRRVAVIRAFAPLPRAFNPAVPTTGYEDLKRVALARLIVDNIPSIQVDWSLYGPKLAQVALTVGADDVDAVSPEDETGEGRRRAPLEEIRRNIRAAGQEPVERNGRFELLDRPANAGSDGAGETHSDRRREGMTRVRLGSVSYLNARPCVVGLDRHPRFNLRFDVPSQCAELLHEGGIDVGLIPAIEYLRAPGQEGYRIVPGVAIASLGPVASVALYSNLPVSAVRSIALDTSSRTSVALTRVLCARAFDIEPSLVPSDPDLPAMLERCDAALLIGDAALFSAGRKDVEKIDLGETWTKLTGLPFVYAFWAGRPDALTAADVLSLQQARDLGASQPEQVAGAYFSDPALQAIGARYLRDNIRYELGEAELAGLALFFRYAAELALVREPGELAFY